VKIVDGEESREGKRRKRIEKMKRKYKKNNSE